MIIRRLSNTVLLLLNRTRPVNRTPRAPQGLSAGERYALSSLPVHHDSHRHYFCSVGQRTSPLDKKRVTAGDILGHRVTSRDDTASTFDWRLYYYCCYSSTSKCASCLFKFQNWRALSAPLHCLPSMNSVCSVVLHHPPKPLNQQSTSVALHILTCPHLSSTL